MEEELYHFGTKGMRWGVRRYQNPDGTLTAEGKKHYRSEYILESREANAKLNKASKKLTEFREKESSQDKSVKSKMSEIVIRNTTNIAYGKGLKHLQKANKLKEFLENNKVMSTSANNLKANTTAKNIGENFYKKKFKDRAFIWGGAAVSLAIPGLPDWMFVPLAIADAQSSWDIKRNKGD